MRRIWIGCAVVAGLLACSKVEKDSDEESGVEPVVEVSADSIRVDNDFFTATFPPGWEVREQDRSLVDLKIPDPDNAARWAAKGSFRLEALPGAPQSVKTIVAKHLKYDEGVSENIDDLTVNGITWSVVITNAIDHPVTLYAPLPVPGIAKVYMENLSLDQPEVKAILESVKFKPPPIINNEPDSVKNDNGQEIENVFMCFLSRIREPEVGGQRESQLEIIY